MRDPDLLHLIERNGKLAKASFGPHYAILPSFECTPEYNQFLADAYGIRVVPIDHLPADSLWTSFETNLVRFLREVEGEVLKSRPAKAAPTSELALLSLRTATQRLLDEAMQATGSLRGDVCLEQHETHSQLIRVAFSPKEPVPSEAIDPNQIIGTVFLNRRENDDRIYLPDIDKAEETLKHMGFTRARYVKCDPAVRSELAVPIYSDGHRTGVLNLESGERARFSKGHIRYAELLAERLGWIRSEVDRRNNAVRKFRPFYNPEGIKKFTGLLGKRRAIEFAGLRFALYDLNYTEGKLVAHSVYQPSDKPLLEHTFEGSSLAAKVLAGGKSIIEREAQKAGEAGQLDLKGVKHFKIKGPVGGFPIRRDGTIISILVTWLEDKPSELAEEVRFKKFRIAS